jgi:PadR family transcriptional regulator PadR
MAAIWKMEELLTFDNSRVNMVGTPPGRHPMPPHSPEILQGTLDMLILRVVASGPLHGWGISQRINAISEDVLRVNQGALYPALNRLEARGLLRAQPGVAENGRRVQCYLLTAAGRKQLGAETDGWHLYARAIQMVLDRA